MKKIALFAIAAALASPVFASSTNPTGPVNGFVVGFTGSTKDGCEVSAAPIKFGEVDYRDGRAQTKFSVNVECKRPVSIPTTQVSMAREGVENGNLEIQFEEVGQPSSKTSGFPFCTYKATLSGVGGQPINKTGAFEIKDLTVKVGQEVVKLRGVSRSAGSVNGSCTISITPGQLPSWGGCKGLEYRQIFSNGDGTETIRDFNEKGEITGSKVVPETKIKPSQWTITPVGKPEIQPTSKYGKPLDEIIKDAIHPESQVRIVY